MLRRYGIRSVFTFTSGVCAARWLDALATTRPADNISVDVILCDETLQDMSGLQLANILAKHPILARIPLVYLSSTAVTPDRITQAVQNGYRGMLLRPYSFEALRMQIHRARLTHEKTQHAQTNTQLFQKALADLVHKTTAQKSHNKTHLALARRFLTDLQYDKALEAFGKALQNDKDQANAYTGMARCWQAKKDIANYHRCLRLAGDAHIKQERFREARMIFDELMRATGLNANPMLQSAANLVHRGEYHAAAGAFLHSSSLTPEITLHHTIARACQFTSRPESAMQHICNAVEELAGPSRAQALRKRLLFTPTKTNESQIYTGTMPSLGTILNVAYYTVRIYRESTA